MATRARPILGVEINMKEIRVVQMSGTWPNIQVTMADSVPTPPGAMQGGRIIAPDLAAVALRRLLSRMRVSTRDAVVGLASRAVMARVIEIPRVPEYEMPLLIAGEMEHYHLLQNGQGVFDYTLLHNAQDGDGASLSVLLMAAEEQMLSGYRDFASMAGLRMVALEPTLIAMYRAAYPQTQNDPFTTSVAISADTSEIALVIQGAIGLYRRLGIGADDLIQGRKNPNSGTQSYNGASDEQRAVAPSLLGTTYETEPIDEESEDYEQDGYEQDGYEQDGYSPAESAPPQDIYAALDLMSARSLATDLERSLDYYRRENPQSGPIQRIVLTTDDPELELLPTWLTEGIAVQVTAATFPACSGKAAALQAPDCWRFLGAAGLAMRNLPNHPDRVPRFDLARHQKRVSPQVLAIRRNVALSLLAAAVFAVICLCAGMPMTARTQVLQSTLNTAKQTLARQQSQLQARLNTAVSHQEELDALRSQTIPFAPIMDAVIGALDPSSRLTAVSLEPGGRVLVAGEALSEQAIINSLNGMRVSPFFDHPSLDSYHLSAIPGSSDTTMQFQVSAPLAGSINAGHALARPSVAAQSH